jgi:quercetin dioxygenase-like cupin family protein
VSHGSGSSAELKLAGEQAGGDWAVVEWRLRAGDEPPIHTHTREDETLYVLDGSITAYVGDQRIDVEAGSYAALPKDVPHGLTVRSGEARLLVTVEPRARSTSSCPATTPTRMRLASGSCSTNPLRRRDRCQEGALLPRAASLPTPTQVKPSAPGGVACRLPLWPSPSACSRSGQPSS